jgi:hypothetical protein
MGQAAFTAPANRLPVFRGLFLPGPLILAELPSETGILCLGQQRGRLKLQELAELSGGVGYTAVEQAIRRVRPRQQLSVSRPHRVAVAR